MLINYRNISKVNNNKGQ